MNVWPCVVLGIDPGATSGFALFSPVRDAPLFSGINGRGDWRGRARVLSETMEYVEAYDLPLVVVREKWGARGAMSGKFNAANMFTGLGRAWGCWEEQIRSALGVSTPNVLQLHTMTWWSRTIGGKKPKRDKALPMQIDYVNRTWGLDVVSDDEAAALCMASVARTHEKTGALLPDSAWHNPIGDWIPRSEKC